MDTTTNVCLKCLGETDCKTCTADRHHCTACYPGFTKSGNDCLCTVGNCDVCDIDPATKCERCAIGYYLNAAKSQCLQCATDAKCAQCDKADDPTTQCTICMPGYYVDDVLSCAACSVSNCLKCNNVDPAT